MKRLPLLALTALFSFAGCSTIQVDLPEDFLITEQTSASFKARTPEDAIFLVERFQLPEGGNKLPYWIKALKQDLVVNRGYVLVSEDEIVAEHGDKGHEFVFETTTQGATYRYLVGLFLQPGPVACVARFTAEKEQFADSVESVRKALRTTRYSW